MNVTPNVSMPLGNKSRTTNILEAIKLKGSTLSNTPLSFNSFATSRGTVKFGNDQIALILGYGDLVQENVTIKRVYYVEGLNHNLFSVGSRGTNLYSITLQDTSTPNPICLMDKATSSQAWLWHRHLSHLNFDTINLLSMYDIVTGLPKLKFVKDHLCSFCELGKAKRQSFKTKTTSSSKRQLQIINMDLCGPMRVESFNGKKYVLVIVDDYSRYTWTHFLRSKDKTPKVLIDFLKLVQRGLHAQVRTVRTDKGTKFLNKTLHAHFAQEGIEHQTSTARTPEQNGNVERWNRTLVEAARTMLSLTKVPLFFWAEAIATTFMSKSSAVTAADAPDQRQQQNTTSSTSTTVAADITPLNIQTTPETTSQAPTQAPTVTNIKNIIQAETNKENSQVKEDEFINIFSTPIEAMQEEIHQFERLDIWELVDKPLCKNVINMKWLWKNKRDEENTLICNKACLVAKGYGQKEGIDFEESFIPVARLEGSCAAVVSIPLANKPLDADLSGTPVDQMKYRSMVGELMYLTASRLNIVHAICYYARYQARPTKKHLREVKRIFRYFKNTINIGLWYPKDTGGDKLVSWSSKKHDCTLMSSAKVEYASLSACYAEVLWLRTQLTDYGFHFDKIPMYCDSKLADLFTKALPEDRFKYLVRRLGMRCLTPEELEMNENKGKMLTKVELTLEQSQQGVSDDVLEASKFVRDFKSLANEADESLAKHKALEFEIVCLLRVVVSQDIMSIVQNSTIVETSNLQTELERTKERFENCIIKKENEYAKLWIDWYKKCEECKYYKISYDKSYNDMQQKIKRLQAELGDLKGKSEDTPCVSDTSDPLSQKLQNGNVELEFQVAESNDLLNSVTSNSIPITTKTNVLKNDKVIALGMFRINPFMTSRVDNDMPNKHVKASVRTNSIIVSQPHVISHKNMNPNSNGISSIGVESTAKTRRPQPMSNTKNDRVPFASKSSCIKNKDVEVEEHHRNLLLSKNKKHMSSEWNNVKLAIQNDKSKVVCVMRKQCLITANHDVCVLNYVNGMNSRGKKQKANVSNIANQTKLKPKIRKPNQVGFKERLASPKPSQPRTCLRWSQTGRIFDLKGKIIKSSKLKSQSDCSKGGHSNMFMNDDIAAILGYSDLQWGNILITRVYFVKGLGHNLFSVRQFCDSDLEVSLRRNTCFARNVKGVDLLKGNCTTNLYTINLHEMASASPICLMARATSTKSWLRHQRLLHLNFDTINDLAKNDLVTGLPKFKYHKEHPCPSCEQGKSKKVSHPPKLIPNSKQRLRFLHMDLCGPMRVESINGKWYILVIVDDYTRYMWVHFLRSKDEAPESLQPKDKENHEDDECDIR
ncbi:retrovirus-related pol polyprotein from transposon TNT 1-94 [Tanacetum coccineum]